MPRQHSTLCLGFPWLCNALIQMHFSLLRGLLKSQGVTGPLAVLTLHMWGRSEDKWTEEKKNNLGLTTCMALNTLCVQRSP